MPKYGVCLVDGCGKRSCARDLCMAHYRRFQRHGNPLGGGKKGNRKFPPIVCSVPDCGLPAHGRGLCRGHYTKWWRYGDPLTSLEPNQNKALPWLSAHVSHNGDDCLIWPFSRDKKTGYGKVCFRNRYIPASRAMCILAHGEPPKPAYHAAHSCGKAHDGCVNPVHLRWALPSENSQDKVRHGTAKQLTRSDIADIRLLSEYLLQREIAIMYGVRQSQISRALTGARRAKHD